MLNVCISSHGDADITRKMLRYGRSGDQLAVLASREAPAFVETRGGIINGDLEALSTVLQSNSLFQI